MTVSEIRAWVVIHRDAASDAEVAMFNRLLYTLDDWQAMREFVHDIAVGLHRDHIDGERVLADLRLKP